MNSAVIDLKEAERRERRVAWAPPRPISTGLLPVPPFDSALVPESIAPWVLDVAERMQCPADFVAAPAVVALGAVLGRKIAVRPQQRTDWWEVPNLWGCGVGRPGSMKSPSNREALRFLHRLEADARTANEAAADAYSIEVEAYKLKKEAAQKTARSALSSNRDADLSSALSVAAPVEPTSRRYMVNDTSYEVLGEINAANPNGVLVDRDELVPLLKTLDREEYAAARGFYLTAWSGTTSYTFDRISRGNIHIPAACLSMFGGTQPGRLAEYMSRAVRGGAGDDGLIQRFQVMVWPDQSTEWKEVDRYPDSDARDAAWDTFKRLDYLVPQSVQAIQEDFSPVPFLRLAPDASETFVEWRTTLESRLRSGDLHPCLESHLAKYRKLVPALALINHLADGGTGSVSDVAMLRSIAFADYLEEHAKRAYASGTNAEAGTALILVKRIRRADLKDGFTLRDIQRNGWTGLTDRDDIAAALDLLVDHDWIAENEPIVTGGRPKRTFRINPKAVAA